MGDNNCPDVFEEHEFGDTSLAEDDLFSIFESLESVADFPLIDEAVAGTKELGEEINTAPRLVSQKSTSSIALQDQSGTELETSPKTKRQKLSGTTTSSGETNPEGQNRISHITVERNRRKQMNDHLSVLRSLMPCFYVKRGDQASIIGGVIDYINELQQVLHSLEAKKQRKVYSTHHEVVVLSPRLVSSPRPSPLSPRSKPALSPRLNLPISPRTPQPSSPYKPRKKLQLQAAGAGYISPTMPSSLEPSPASSSTTSSINDNVNELVANSKSPIAEVEVKFSGPNLLLKTVSTRIPGQAMKIISALEDLSLEILHLRIITVDETILINSFTIKVGIECQLSAEELAQQIQQTFYQVL
ncbi:transcription factor SPEECHLESS-like [Juglans microcarpa x Juglans regia]|uniref:transcription factor SPEECHLESS-like n=1 Tax=Juglans microcarpa x Juglans regia TaxID=2249226 RepID=UPI001B7F5D3A|nr:transcription factor SPEECHLESS-like [Juglans microcarpa x Juglans regia]